MNCYSLSQYSKQSCPFTEAFRTVCKKYNVDSVCFQHRCMWKKANVVQLYNLNGGLDLGKLFTGAAFVATVNTSTGGADFHTVRQ